MNRLYSITVVGRDKTWGFPVKGTEQDAQDWRDDGLEVWELTNTVPVWAQRLGLTKPWCGVQDAWNWVRLF